MQESLVGSLGPLVRMPILTNRPKHSRTKKKNMVATKVSLQDLLASSCKPTRASAVCGKFNSVSGYACRSCMLVISLLPRGTWGNGSPGERPPGGRVLGKPNSFPGGTFPWGTFPRGTMNKPREKGERKHSALHSATLPRVKSTSRRSCASHQVGDSDGITIRKPKIVNRRVTVT